MSVKVVVDSSVIIKWLNKANESNIDEADRLMESAIKGETELLAPELSKYEIGNVLLKSKKLTYDQALISLGTAYALPITFINESYELAKQTYFYADTLDITYYDASFLAIAKEYNAILITENTKHQGKTNDVLVKSIQEY